MKLIKLSKEEFKEFADKHEQITFHQTEEWANLKKENGWEAIYYGDCNDSEVVNIKSFNEIPKCLTKYLK